jgi:TolB protein
MNNSKIVYTFYHNNYTDVVAYDTKSRKTYRLANYPGLNNGGVISPNGQYLAMILSKDKKVALYVRNVNGGSSRRITNSEGVDGCPAWSPDNKKICFVSNMVAERPSLYISDFTTNKIYPVRCLGSQAVNPSWSPDGSKIIYSAKVGNFTLAVYDVNTGVSTLVEMNAGGDWFSPSWAPDSRHVVCSRRLDYFYQLYMVDTFTGRAIKICSSKMNLSSPDWSNLYK